MLNQLDSRHDLKNRVKSILSVAIDDGDGIADADEAESRVIEEVRRMGDEVLTGWTESRAEKSEANLPADENIVRSGQKKYIGTAPSEKYMCSGRNTNNRENGTDRSVKMPG